MATEYDLITRYARVFTKEELERIIKGINNLEEGGHLYDKKDNNTNDYSFIFVPKVLGTTRYNWYNC